MDDKQKRQLQFSSLWVIIALLAIWLLQGFVLQPLTRREREVPYSQFRQDLDDAKIAEVTLGEDSLSYPCPPSPDDPVPTPERSTGIFPPRDDTLICTVQRVEDPGLVEALLQAGVEFSAEPPASGILTTLLSWVIPLIPFVFIWFFLFRRIGQAGGGVMSVGKSKAREIAGEMTGIKFDDVGGLDEVEVELKEIIAFLKDPSRFARIGAKLPKGVLLVGPPGTGKTLLAKATAGEAGVPFFSISGSGFVEMFVGVGAARVRDMFEQAKARAPVIIFIDEIDAIGQARTTAGSIGTNDEREQTLNALLAEMDGFEPNQGVVIMAATNRPEILDKALLRPGRFDRQIQVPLPTERGRRQILKIHTTDVRLGPDVDLDRLAQITSGFSGADLANIVNEAALLAVRRDSDQVAMDDMDLAIERVVAGLQRQMPMRQEVKRRVAYHEGGHALVAELLESTDPVHKVSIIPTAKGALGYTMQMPEEDQYLLGECELKERMAVMLGGRSAELIVFEEPSTGASNDLERASDLARRMVTEFGMTEALGPVRYAPEAGSGYLGFQVGNRSDVSPETASAIDREVRRLVEEAQKRALELLRERRGALDEIARVLQDKEVISGDDIRKIVQGGQG